MGVRYAEVLRRAASRPARTPAGEAPPPAAVLPLPEKLEKPRGSETPASPDVFLAKRPRRRRSSGLSREELFGVWRRKLLEASADYGVGLNDPITGWTGIWQWFVHHGYRTRRGTIPTQDWIERWLRSFDERSRPYFHPAGAPNNTVYTTGAVLAAWSLAGMWRTRLERRPEPRGSASER
jgi:hypothetical protein